MDCFEARRENEARQRECAYRPHAEGNGRMKTGLSSRPAHDVPGLTRAAKRVVIRIRQTMSFRGRRRAKFSVPLESLAPTEESLRWARHSVGYDWLLREEPARFR
jgi:hypothetical protein